MNWGKDRDTIAQAYFNRINANNIELFNRIRDNFEHVRDVFPIIKFILDRLDTVSFLTIHERLRDAEIVQRSVLETTTKLLFIINKEGNDKEVALREFWHDLSEIMAYKHSEHAKEHIKHFKDESNILAQSALILSEEREKEIKSKWNRKERKQIEQKWSFSEILNLLRKNYQGQQYDIMIGLAHSYRMASHVAHGDETGILIIEERESRTEEEKQIVHRGHFIKLISECFYFPLIISFGIMDLINADKTFFIELHKSLESIRELESVYHGKVFEDSIYDKFRKENDKK